jgi:triosephosphate isomerase
MRPLIIANWKANPSTLTEAKSLLLRIKKGLDKKRKVDIVICPPFIFLSELRKIIGKRIKLGSQDVFWREGAFTGQVSARMLKDVGCRYAIVGHSEKRIMGETNRTVNKKITACLGQKVVPIFCIGETEEQKETGKTFQILKTQIREGLENISRNQVEKIIIAYEPIWAIGTGENCAYDEAMSISLLIKKILASLYNQQILKKVKIIYGGSVNFSTIEGYIKESTMNGVLVGGASLKVNEFIAILKKF